MPLSRPRVRRVVPGVWAVERPRVGFGTGDTVVEPFDSWEHAMASLRRTTGAAAAQAALATKPVRPRGYWRTSNTPVEIT